MHILAELVREEEGATEGRIQHTDPRPEEV